MVRRKLRDRVVLDTSVLISSLWGGASQEVVHRWKHGLIQPIVSDEIVEEYLRVLARFDLSRRALRGWALWLTHPSKVTVVNPARHFAASRDQTDNKFLDAATAGNAALIITRDKDLLALKRHRRARILTPEEALDELGSTS